MSLARYGWVPVLALALAFLAVDSARRLDAVAAVSSVRLEGAPDPAPDPSSPSGFEAGQHRLVLPTAGTDGYHWILQTETMVAEGALRVRRTDVDNAPEGREVHWSAPPRWWLAALARARAAVRPDLGPGLALEQVAPGAGAVALGLILLLGAPVVARLMGSAAAALFAGAWVAVFPLYETFMVGIVDHHGWAAATALVSTLLLVVGGGGLVREGAGSGGGLPVPRARAARAWFAASGVVAGLGLWVSAATLVPVLAGTAAGALLASRVRGGEGVRAEPGAWRI